MLSQTNYDPDDAKSFYVLCLPHQGIDVTPRQIMTLSSRHKTLNQCWFSEASTCGIFLHHVYWLLLPPVTQEFGIFAMFLLSSLVKSNIVGDSATESILGLRPSCFKFQIRCLAVSSDSSHLISGVWHVHVHTSGPKHNYSIYSTYRLGI